MAGDCLRMCPNVVLRAHIQANKAVFASNCAQSSVVGHTFRQSDEKWRKNSIAKRLPHKRSAEDPSEKGSNWRLQQESNPYQQYRKLLFYPLNYGGISTRDYIIVRAAPKDGSHCTLSF